MSDEHKWYVVHTTSGYETKAKDALEKRIENQKRGEFLSEILIPSENIVKLVKEGKNDRVEIVVSELQKETWY